MLIFGAHVAETFVTAANQAPRGAADADTLLPAFVACESLVFAQIR